MSAEAQYEYYDGSGNGYILNHDSLHYKPITPRESSSGIYSGGEPKSVPISNIQFEKVKIEMEAALEKLDEQQDDREMMTGLLVRKIGSDSSRVVLRRGSASKNEIESSLKNILFK